jgi:hypothetical protein
VVPGRQDVGEHHIVVLLLPRVLGQHEGVPVRVRHAQQFGLAAVVRPHVGVAVGRAGIARIGGEAEAAQTRLAVLAEAASDVERQTHHVADLHPVDTVADLDHLAEVLVAEDLAFLDVGAALLPENPPQVSARA